MSRSLLSFQRYYINLLEEIRKSQKAEPPRSKLPRRSQEGGDSDKRYVCGTCVAIAGLKRNHDKMKELLISGNELVPMAWIKLKDFMPLDIFRLRTEIEQKKTIDGMATEYLKNLKDWDPMACSHFEITFENDDRDKSEFIWLPLIWVFGKEEFCAELRILLLYSKLDVRKQYINLHPFRRKCSIIMELIADEPPSHLMEFTWTFYSLLERVLQKKNLHLFEIILETRPEILEQDTQNLAFEPSRINISSHLKLGIIQKLYHHHSKLYFLIQKAILSGADLNSSEESGLLEVQNNPWDNQKGYFTGQIDVANLLISHGLMDFRNKSSGSVVLAFLDCFYSWSIRDINPAAVKDVEAIIITVESLGYQFYGVRETMENEEKKLRLLRECSSGATRIQILVKHLQRMKASPLSLKFYARNEIRFALGGKNFLQKLHLVLLPDVLKECVRCIMPPKMRTKEL